MQHLVLGYEEGSKFDLPQITVTFYLWNELSNSNLSAYKMLSYQIASSSFEFMLMIY